MTELKFKQDFPTLDDKDAPQIKRLDIIKQQGDFVLAHMELDTEYCELTFSSSHSGNEHRPGILIYQEEAAKDGVLGQFGPVEVKPDSTCVYFELLDYEIVGQYRASSKDFFLTFVRGIEGI